MPNSPRKRLERVNVLSFLQKTLSFFSLLSFMCPNFSSIKLSLFVSRWSLGNSNTYIEEWLTGRLNGIKVLQNSFDIILQ